MNNDWKIYGYEYYVEQTNPDYTKRYIEEIKKLDWRLTEINKGKLILDIGAGNPIDAIRASWLGARFISLDLLTEDIISGKDYIERKLPHLSGLVDFIVADATKLPIKDNIFDAVVSYSAIEHMEGLEKHKKWIEEMARVTKVGGDVILTTENKLNFLCFFLHPFRLIDYKRIKNPRWLYIFIAFVSFWFSKKFKSFKRFVPFTNEYYETWFTPYQLEQLLKEAGLIPKLFDSDMMYYIGYRPPIPWPKVLKIICKIESYVNKLDLRFLKRFKLRIGYIAVKASVRDE